MLSAGEWPAVKINVLGLYNRSGSHLFCDKYDLSGSLVITKQ